MSGHRAPGEVEVSDGIRIAHAGGTLPVEVGHIADRRWREDHEDAQMSGGATRARGAGNRARSEAPCEVRTCFERDRDRILHSRAFRRLAGKTQVFVFPQDHQRTRLTHALEVAQVATSISRSLQLNVALTEAIALGHDCGHGPGGHASEDALSPYVDGGFDHAVWGADVILEPLNLCSETLDGIRNHSWSRPRPSTPEGLLVSWADRIAYTAHDFEDAVSTGIVSEEMLPEVVAERCGRRRSRQLNAFVRDMVDTAYRSGVIAMSDDLAEALGAFRRFNYEHIYLRPASVAQADSVIAILRGLVEYYTDRPHHLAQESAGGDPVSGGVVSAGAAPLVAGSPEAARSAVTWVCGMTDRFACAQALALLGWDPAKLPQGIDMPRSR